MNISEMQEKFKVSREQLYTSFVLYISLCKLIAFNHKEQQSEVLDSIKRGINMD